MTLEKDKWYVIREGEGIIDGPYDLKREAMILSDALAITLKKRTTRDGIYPSMYHAGYGILLAKGSSFELAGYEYYFDNK